MIYFLSCTFFFVFFSFVNSSFFCSSLSSDFHTYLINRYYCNTDKVDNERSATNKPFTCISVFFNIFSFFVTFCIYIYFLSLSFFTYLLLLIFFQKKSFSFQFPLKTSSLLDLPIATDFFFDYFLRLIDHRFVLEAGFKVFFGLYTLSLSLGLAGTFKIVLRVNSTLRKRNIINSLT